jgi:putative aldouronate transport system permease protein
MPVHYKYTAGEKVFSIINIVFMILLMIIMLYPLYYVLIVSLSDGKAVMRGEVNLFPVNVTLSSYKLIFADNSIILAFWNTVKYTVVGTLVNVFMTTLAAYALSKPKLIGKSFFMGFITFTMFFSGGMVPMYLVVSKLKMINTIWAIVIPGSISTYNMIVMRTFFAGIPYSLHESALIDGAGEAKILTNIVLPLSKPIIATMVLFYAVGHWNSFMPALLYLNKREMYPIQIFLRNLAFTNDSSQFINQTGAASNFLTVEETIKCTVIIVATVPILIVYPFLQKYFVSGVTIGSLKG